MCKPVNGPTNNMRIAWAAFFLEAVRAPTEQIHVTGKN